MIKLPLMFKTFFMSAVTVFLKWVSAPKKQYMKNKSGRRRGSLVLRGGGSRITRMSETQSSLSIPSICCQGAFGRSISSSLLFESGWGNSSPPPPTEPEDQLMSVRSLTSCWSIESSVQALRSSSFMSLLNHKCQGTSVCKCQTVKTCRLLCFISWVTWSS